MISNLVYASIKSKEYTKEDIDKILAAAERNNPPLNITGVLLHTPDRFIQYLEGDYDQIISLYEKIKEDKRHKNVIMVSLNKDQREERLFPNWAMAGKSLESEEVIFDSKLSNDEKETFRSTIKGETVHGDRSVKIIQKLFH